MSKYVHVSDNELMKRFRNSCEIIKRQDGCCEGIRCVNCPACCLYNNGICGENGWCSHIYIRFDPVLLKNVTQWLIDDDVYNNDGNFMD